MNARKRIATSGTFFLALALLVTPALAQTDYSGTTTEQLSAMRGTMQGASAEDRQAFRNEWQNRVATMNQEERQAVVGKPANAAQSGAGSMNRQGKMNGKGGGQGRRGR